MTFVSIAIYAGKNKVKRHYQILSLYLYEYRRFSKADFKYKSSEGLKKCSIHSSTGNKNPDTRKLKPFRILNLLLY